MHKQISLFQGCSTRTSTLLRWCIIFLFFSLLFKGNLSHAQAPGPVHGGQEEPPRFELDEVVVTGTRIEETVKDIPRNVTVITSEDIEQAPSSNIIDLLARESGVNPRAFFGHDKWAAVDIRGMGQTFVTNVTVMVDGVKRNSADLTGPDLASVSMDQIERIEIVRGAGSVLYGDGAVGGVVNIITKKGQEEPETALYTSYGSYDTFDGRASHRGRIKDLGLSVNAEYYDSDGYRENGYLRKKDAGMHLDYDWRDFVTLTLIGSLHEDSYGLPGPVEKEVISSRNRRTETEPERLRDSGENTDDRLIGGVEIDLGHWGRVQARRGYRFRDNDYVQLYHPLLAKDEQTDNIDEETRNFHVGYDNTYEIGGLDHGFQCGLDHYETEYVREELSRKRRKNSKTKSIGLFATNDWSLTQDLSLRLGYRHDEYDGRFRTDDLKTFGDLKRWVNGASSIRDFTHNVYDAGMVYKFSPELTFFASYATSFRIPNVDEFAQEPQDQGLKPQEGNHIDLGGRYRFKGFMEVALTVFQIKIEDEIYFDEPDQRNRNYEDDTMRRGLEVDVRMYPTDALFLWGNCTYVDAEFEEQGTTVPLVPKHKASIGLEWQISKPLVLSLTGNYVAPRFDGNDLSNEDYDQLDRYVVFDGKLTYEYRGIKLFFGVNNVFDELYSSLAYSETYYPMPTRNFYGGMKWVF